MTKARTIADLGTGFVNISDTGTEGTKVASGTTAQRGSTAGQLRFNTTTNIAEYYDGNNFRTLDTPPTISSISPTVVANLAGGNETFTITGSNFLSGASVEFVGNDGTIITASSVTVNSATSITAVIAKSEFNNTKEPYDVKVLNSSGLSGEKLNQINVDNDLTWVTASGQIASINTASTGTHVTVQASDPDGDTISYSEIGGTVLSSAGLTLNSSTGAISGTPNSAGTLNFTLRATANTKTADRAFSILVVNAYTASFLVIAGGGGGGGYYYSGGGGAGGYRSSYNSESSGGGGSAETPLVFTPNTVYTVTVGAGGAGGAGYAIGAKGSNSSISGSNITTLTSIAGGRGKHENPGNTDADADGGSGGGANSTSSASSGGSGTANQGYNGGDSTTGGSTGTTGGGGGAGQVGETKSSGSAGGAGGNGVASTITGSSVTRGGGGGGSSYNSSRGGGGTGGGGGGAENHSNTQASAGTANTGGGGGSASHTATPNGGAGGSGVVILRMLTSKYSGTTSGSPTVTTDGSDTILTFNASGSYTG